VSANHSPAERAAIARRASLLTIAINIALTIARVVAGFLAGSTAVLADGANSATDICAGRPGPRQPVPGTADPGGALVWLPPLALWYYREKSPLAAGCRSVR
jgi:hypothetical protein